MTHVTLTECPATADVDVASAGTTRVACILYDAGTEPHAGDHHFPIEWLGGAVTATDHRRTPDHRTFQPTNPLATSPRFKILEDVALSSSPEPSPVDEPADAMVDALATMAQHDTSPAATDDTSPVDDEPLTVSFGDDERADFATDDGWIRFTVGARRNPDGWLELNVATHEDEDELPIAIVVDGRLVFRTR